jgi:hypothetical protein
VVCFCGWGAEPSSVFLTLDAFKAKPSGASAELRFQGYGGYDIFLGTRDGLSRLELRFGSRVVGLVRSGDVFGYGEGSWMANKPLEWRGVKVRGVFEPYALIFRSFRPRAEGGRPVETYVVVSLEGCDSRVIGAFPAEEGPLEAVRHADREWVRSEGTGRVLASRRLMVERAVAEWLAAVRAGDEKRVRGAYSSGFLRANGRRAGKLEGGLGRIARFGDGEATGFSVREEGGRLEVAFSLIRAESGSGDAEPLRVKLGMLVEGASMKISSESVEGGDLRKAVEEKGAAQVVGAAVSDASGDPKSELGQLLIGRWLASDGKGMMTLVFEQEGRVFRKRLGASGKGDPGAYGAWAVRDGVLTVDLGKGEEERKLTPLKGGRFKLEGRGGVLFVEKQR